MAQFKPALLYRFYTNMITIGKHSSFKSTSLGLFLTDRLNPLSALIWNTKS